MKHGICLTPVYPQAITDYSCMEMLLEKISRQKLFDCVEIYFEGTQEQQKLLREALKNRNLEAVYLGGLPIKRDGIDLSAEDEVLRRRSVEICKSHIERAMNIGCKKIVIASGPDWKKENLQRKVVRQMQRSLADLEECCRNEDLEITLEPFPVNTDPYLAVGDVKTVQDIFQSGCFKNVGLTFDTSHFSQMGVDVMKSFQLLMPWIRHVHLANCVMNDKKDPLYGDKHPLFKQKNGDFSIGCIKEFYREKILEQCADQIDICSIEVISRGNADWYYEEICREAEEIWRDREEEYESKNYSSMGDL